jgi:hypothetical protein
MEPGGIRLLPATCPVLVGHVQGPPTWPACPKGKMTACAQHRARGEGRAGIQMEEWAKTGPQPVAAALLEAVR